MTDQRRDAARTRTSARQRDAAVRGYAGRGYAPEPEPRGRHLGPIPITATGVLIVVALVLSLGFLAFVITVRDPSQIPLLAAGTVILGIVFAAIAIVGGRAT